MIKALLVRFGPNAYDDPTETLTRLRKNGIMEDYKARFEAPSKRLRGLFDTYKLSYFHSGLCDDIRLPIRICNPPNLKSAYSLAKIKE